MVVLLRQAAIADKQCPVAAWARPGDAILVSQLGFNAQRLPS